MEPAIELPHDIDSLRTLVLSQRQMLAMRDETIARLEHTNEILRKLAFGKKSEKRPPIPESALQENLFFKEIAAEAARLAERHHVAATVEVGAHVRKKKGRRAEFPEHLPVVRTICELKDDERTCACGGELKEFGEEVARELERFETTIVHEIARKKYACTTCKEGVVTAPWRDRVIPKGLLGPGFLAHVITERFNNHLPYYRIESQLKSEGLDLSRSVLCESMARCAELLSPIADELRAQILADPVIFTDDTPVTLARSENGGSKESRIWAYVNRGGRHWYHFTDSRKRDGPARVLGDYQGFIHADGYPGYDGFFLPGGAVEVACWAHVRRKFVDAETTDATLAKEAVDQIRALFQIEDAAKDLSDEERRLIRQERSRPLIEAFGAWLNEAKTKVLGKSPMMKAITYAENQWEALNRYLADGRLSISNNAAERALRPIAVGRKNWLFFQREGGGGVAAILMSLLQTAKAADVNLNDYFQDVLLRISERGVDVKDLTPHGWKERFAPEVAARRHEILQRLVGAA